MNIFSYRWLGACRSEIIPRNVSTQVSWLRNDINKDQIPRSVLRLFDNVYCLNQRTPVDNSWPKFATSRKFQQHWPPWAAQTPRVHNGVCGPLAASCQLANTWARQRASFGWNGNSNTGATFLYHGTGTFRKSTLGLLRNFLGLMVPCPR